MQDKTFELVEKLYNRMEDGFNSVRAEIQDVKTELKQGIARMEQNMVRMEQKYDNKIDILFDAVQSNTEAINSLRSDMQKLEAKVDAHEIKLKIVK